MFDENGDGPIIVCAAHKLWLENEREACAKIADMQALTSDDEVRQETAEIIAGAIRSRFTNGGSLT
jgi:hypothetical protein